MELTNLSIKQLQEGLLAEKRQFSAIEVAESYLEILHRHENKKKTNEFVGAFITILEDSALAKAKELDKKIERGDKVGSLVGLPLGVKDVFATQGIITTAGSKILENYKPPYSATVVERVESADVIILGKTNCDEFAMGTSGENSAYYSTHNPWDLSRVPGGSSSGSAAAVAAGECLAALGTDTGGSVRQPAAFCGVVGVKPTYGRVSRYGLIAMASSLDQGGVIARSVEDAAYLLQTIAGYDAKDATSVDNKVPDYIGELNKPVKDLVIGIPREFFGEGMEPGVAEAVKQAIAEIEKLGVKIKEVSLPSMPYALAAYYILTPAEVSANLARYDGMRYGESARKDILYETYARTRGQFLGAEAKRRIMLGTYVLSAGYYEAYYQKAKSVQLAIKHDFAKIFEQVDLLVTPTSPTVAFTLGSKVDDPLALYLADINTVPVNIAGLPAISVPCGFAAGLPVGLQLIAKPWAEATMLRLAYAYEQVTEWHNKKPSFKK
jgi:aspartyl-tRNA(Asn)/glutamyl-tRNA(Gln) amidotransferase subunit A